MTTEKLYQQIQYIKFLKCSSNQHGVHSPFVYDLVTKCFYDKTRYPEYQQIEAYRKSLINNPESLTITDFGSGSKLFKDNHRHISKMAKTAGTTLKRAQLLYRLVQYFKPKRLLELGTSLGMATQAMALGHPDGHITSVEGCPQLANFAEKSLLKQNLSNVNIINNTFDEGLLDLRNNHYDLVFIDGHHNKKATLNNFNQLLPSLHNDSILIFDDIHWSKGMAEAWETIKAHEKVSVSIDTFYWGFIFVRKEQAKEHFTIRL